MTTKQMTIGSLIVAIIGVIVALAQYIETSKKESSSIEQQSSGDASPNIGKINGNVEIKND